jgi:hypothetical protein
MNPREIAFFVVILLLLFALIIVSLMKLGIFFETFMSLQKKQNFDKANYISNSSFFKYYYRNKLGGSIAIESVSSITLFILSVIAFVGFLTYGHLNYGYLNYYYGDTNEYYFIKIFIYMIIFVMFLHIPSLVAHLISLDENNDLLIKNEIELKTYLADNLDYVMLYDYFLKTKGGVIKEYSMRERKINSDTKSDELFKLCFTYHIMEDDRFTLIKQDLMGLIRDLNISEKTVVSPTGGGGTSVSTDGGTGDADTSTKIRDAILNASDFYIIARYNHNNNVVLPSLQTILSLVKTKVNETAQNHLSGIISGSGGSGNKKILNEISEQHEKTIDTFRKTIQIYKKIYDIYYSYFIVSILITNFFVIYAILVFVYILIKIALYYGSDTMEDGYNIYYFFQYLTNTGVYILTLYYFLTCPIIIFGFN